MSAKEEQAKEYKYKCGITIETTNNVCHLEYSSSRTFTLTNDLCKRYNALIQAPQEMINGVDFKLDVLKTVLKIDMRYQSWASAYAMDYLKHNLYKASCDYNDTVTLHACLFMVLNDFGAGTGTHSLYGELVNHNSSEDKIKI